MTAVLVLFLVGALAVIAVVLVDMVQSRRRVAQLVDELQTVRAKYDQDAKKWTEYLASLKAENDRLSKYRGVADADAKAHELLKAGQAALQKAEREAAARIAEAEQKARSIDELSKELLGKTNDEVKAIMGDARRQAKELRDTAASTLDSATVQARDIVEVADKRAHDIAGSAYEAMKNVALYDQAIKALKNMVNGYGDQYLIPTYNLLDEMGEEFGYTEAGKKLQAAREVPKAMIRTGTAARCDYSEPARRVAATSFVIDAFNGKVDSILSRVRQDNAGTLAQEIRDAFALVNLNGKAFRDARISEEYMDARLEELKWGAIVHELKMRQREEQRRIKEQIREEEKARKEFERAIREAAKEEDIIKKAMEKARQQAEQANAEQKTKYEQQLQDLAQRLKEAEERNQRALSMAQQTKRGHVYIISNVGSFGENVYKIGLTRRLEPLDRVKELGDASVPFEFDVHALIFSEDAPALENQLHKHFVIGQLNKVNFRKEFFRADLAHIRDEVEKLGINAKWTMAAAACEYRESLAIEKAIKDNPVAKEAWLQRQLELESVVGNLGAEEDLEMAAGG